MYKCTKHTVELMLWKRMRSCRRHRCKRRRWIIRFGSRVRLPTCAAARDGAAANCIYTYIWRHRWAYSYSMCTCMRTCLCICSCYMYVHIYVYMNNICISVCIIECVWSIISANRLCTCACKGSRACTCLCICMFIHISTCTNVCMWKFVFETLSFKSVM